MTATRAAQGQVLDVWNRNIPLALEDSPACCAVGVDFEVTPWVGDRSKQKSTKRNEWSNVIPDVQY